MISKRSLGVGAATIAVAMAAAGCAGGATSSSSSSSNPNTVSFESWAPVDPALSEMVKAFEKEHPGKKITTDVMGGPDYWTDLQARASSNTMPDIVGLMPGSQTQQYRSKLIPLNNCAKSAWGANWKKKFFPIGLEQAQLGNPKGDKNFYGLPVLNQIMMNWENSDIFSKYHLSTPKTWSQLVSTVQKLKKDQSATPFLFGAKESWLTTSVFFEISANVAPGLIYKAENGQAKWTSAGMVKSFAWYKKLFTDNIAQPGAVAYEPYPNGVDALAAGKAAIMTNGSQWIQESNPTAKQSTIPALLKGMQGYEPFVMPTIPGGAKTSQFVGGSEFLFGISKQSKHKKLACQVITNWIAGSGNQKLVNTLFDLPAVKGIAPTKFTSAKQKALFELMDKKWLPKVRYSRYFEYPKITTVVGNVLAALGSGQDTPAQAAAAVQKVENGLDLNS